MAENLIVCLFYDTVHSIQFHQVFAANFEFIKLLGTGKTGRVWLARKLNGTDKDTLYAIKVLQKFKEQKTEFSRIFLSRWSLIRKEQNVRFP